tara:strand:+ start:91 stop:630 length:540 start_codon:yes stop_codon:yes gene_type:complete
MSNPLIDKETEFEKEMNQYMRVYYDLLGCTYEWDDKKNNFIGDKKKDVTLYYDGKTILIEHKYRDFDRVEYFDILVEVVQDVKDNDVGWIYECDADKLHYIICKTIEGIMQPIYYHRIKFKLFRDWFFCWREVEKHPKRIISKEGHGHTINIAVPLNKIPDSIIKKKIIIKNDKDLHSV